MLVDLYKQKTVPFFLWEAIKQKTLGPIQLIAQRLGYNGHAE